MSTLPPPPGPPYDPPIPNGPYGNPQYGYNAPTPPPKRPAWLIPVIAGGVALLVLIIILVAVFASSNDPTPTPTIPPVTITTTTPVPTTPTPAPVKSPRVGADDERFLTALQLTDSTGIDHSKFWKSYIDNNRTGLIQTGYEVCGAYDEGSSAAEIVTSLQRNASIPQAEANWLRAASVVTLCPEHRSTN